MNQFCEKKGILRQFSVAKTPQQIRVAKRRNKTLIKATRTMLADSKLPTTFWAKAVSTACYVQNRVLVVKPHNKTPYELFHSRTPTLCFMRRFRCHVTILNTIDHLGKFDGKADEGFFVGYSLNSKAFRVFISDKDYSTVNAAGTNEVNDNIELPFDQKMLALEDDSIFRYNNLIFDFLNDDEDDGAIADMNNLDTTIQVSSIPTTRIHKDHPLDQVFRNKMDEKGIVIRNKAGLVAQGYIQKERIDYDEVFAPGFEDPDFPDKIQGCYMHCMRLLQAP
ncbi:retrovirus-related pol polyprotein from transposon TNT 1-94 [Tanacetum coccineum]